MRTDIYRLAILAILLFWMGLLIGCSEEDGIEPSEFDTAKLMIVTKAGGDDPGEEKERLVKTLRLMIFDASGDFIKSFYYSGADLENALKVEGGVYTITERLQKNLGPIKIVLVANEPSTWGLSGGITYSQLKDLKIQYDDGHFNFIGSNGVYNDMNLYVSPDDYFLMFTETSVHFGTGNVEIFDALELERTAAKVTLVLQYNDFVPLDETFVLKRVAIHNQPIYSLLAGQVYNNDDELLPTSYVPFSMLRSAAGYIHETRPIVFYIPEYYLSQEAFASDVYTYIEVVGEYTRSGSNLPVIVTYRIPLGEGVQRIFDASPGNPYIPQRSDYTIQRNHHYIVNGVLSKLGEIDGIQIEIAVKGWEDGGTIDVDNPAPYLNVSEIALERYISQNRLNFNDSIFFWSNQPMDDISLELIGCDVITQSGTVRPFNTLFGLEGSSYDVNMKKYASGSTGFYQNNGYVMVNLNVDAYDFLQGLLFQRIDLMFYVRAGNLKRRITVSYYREIPVTR